MQSWTFPFPCSFFFHPPDVLDLKETQISTSEQLPCLRLTKLLKLTFSPWMGCWWKLNVWSLSAIGVSPPRRFLILSVTSARNICKSSPESSSASSKDGIGQVQKLLKSFFHHQTISPVQVSGSPPPEKHSPPSEHFWPQLCNCLRYRWPKCGPFLFHVSNISQEAKEGFVEVGLEDSVNGEVYQVSSLYPDVHVWTQEIKTHSHKSSGLDPWVFNLKYLKRLFFFRRVAEIFSVDVDCVFGSWLALQIITNTVWTC